MTCFFGAGQAHVTSARLHEIVRWVQKRPGQDKVGQWSPTLQIWKTNVFRSTKRETNRAVCYFKKLIRPLMKGIYKFACKKHSNVEEKQPQLVFRKWWFLLSLERSVLIQGFFLGKRDFFQSPATVRKGIPPEKDAWTCKRGSETSHWAVTTKLGSPTPQYLDKFVGPVWDLWIL